MKRGPRATAVGKPGIKLDARAYALRLIELRPRTIWEIEDQLAKKGAYKSEAADIISWLESIGLLNDAKFARDWIDSRWRLRPMGPTRMRAELVKKGISREIISAALNEFVNNVDQEALALPLAEKKIRTWRGLEREKIISRMSGFLARRGFSAQTINNVLKKVLKGYDDLE